MAFTKNHFFDGAHLSEEGAIKFTHALDTFVETSVSERQAAH